MDPIIAASARKRPGVSDEDMIHAYRMQVRNHGVDGEGFTMIVGPMRTGELIELGYLISDDDGRVVIVHCLRPARRKYR